MKTLHPWMLIGPLMILLAAAIEGLLLQRSRGHYDWRAFFASAGDLGLRIAAGILPLGLAGAALGVVWDHRIMTMPLHSPWTWALLFIGQDFFYYWMHRADHAIRWLWATHSVHHSPRELNLSAAYRLGFTARLSVGPVFFAPLVFIGFSPLTVGAALAANLLYQFWLHAQWIPRLGPLEWILNTPAHHRVHHASNREYLDKNFGGVFIIFDRAFGTFCAEVPGVTIRYGLVDPIISYNPLRVGLNEWIAIARDLVASRSLRQFVSAAFGRPGSTILVIGHPPSSSPVRQCAKCERKTQELFMRVVHSNPAGCAIAMCVRSLIGSVAAQPAAPGHCHADRGLGKFKDSFERESLHAALTRAASYNGAMSPMTDAIGVNDSRADSLELHRECDSVTSHGTSTYLLLRE